MNSELTAFTESARRDHGDLRANWRTVFSRPLTAKDWVDTAVLGGEQLADILKSGSTVVDGDIDPEVIDAFHGQYPGEDTFTEFVRRNSDPEELRGIVSGIKGKLFEQEYVDFLNDDGHLPDGFQAILAESATQPGWDVLIQGPDGATVELLQLKCTASTSIIREALDRYPDFDVVAAHEAFAAISDPELLGNVIDSGIPDEFMAEKVQLAAGMASATQINFHFPVFALLFIVGTASHGYLKGNTTLKETLGGIADRAKPTLAASVLSHVMVLMTHEPILGLPTSIIFRLGWARLSVGQLFVRLTNDRCKRLQSQSDRWHAGLTEKREPRGMVIA